MAKKAQTRKVKPKAKAKAMPTKPTKPATTRRRGRPDAGPKTATKKTTRKKSRVSKLASCIRKTAATVRIRKHGMPDEAKFDPKSLTAAMSGKFFALIQKIKELDISDESKYGTKFKHFIFTDIRESAFGAKALAGFLIAAGFDFRMGNIPKLIKRHGKMVKTKKGETALIHKKPVKGGSNGFALLQSLPLWKTPLFVAVKKDILTTFNSRPENVNGELLRIIVLDSKFKEGIDLKDVKYVHLLEPPIAASDLKQAVGRATRFCGQSGLRFIPRRGWPLQVFVYNTELPGRPPFATDVQKTDAHELMLKHSGLDLALINLTKELTVLAIKTAVDYDLNFKINNFKIEEALLEEAELDDELVGEVEAAQQGGALIKAIHRVKDLTPDVLSKCFKRSSKLFPFSKRQLRATALSMGYRIPDIYPRELYCRLLARDGKYLKTMLTNPVDRIRARRAKAPRVSSAPSTPSPASSAAEVTASAESSVVSSVSTESPIFSPSSTRSSITDSRASSAISAVSRVSSKAKSPEEVFATAEFRKALAALKGLPFAEFQTAVSRLYDAFKWESPVVKNGCKEVAAGKPGQPVSFTRTQDFVRHFLVPDSPFKGLLAWHSVGTGKTCMAVAAASSAFEAAGYTILWVTRNALMSDVYKNIFGAVCSIPIMEAIKEGEEIPEDITAAKRMLSRQWLPPITYRMFQNALQGKNELGRMLLAKSKRDPLHRTFLVMDEVHKLMDGDLSAAESADFEKIQAFIQKSYAVSGVNSVRPLLMTATPITDTPRELFMILNTLIGEPSRRLMPFEEFRTKYTDERGAISADGASYFQDRAKGLISYLNREYDPTTFAQPEFHDVLVPAGGIIPPTLEELVGTCMSELEVPEVPFEALQDDCDELDKEAEAELQVVEELDLKPAAMKREINKIKKTFKKKKAECIKRNKRTLKAHKAAVKSVLKAAGSCYSTQLKAYRKTAGPSQIKELEACFGKKAGRSEFPSKGEFLEAFQQRQAVRETNGDSISSADAVFMNNK
jgi:hypothetical protein